MKRRVPILVGLVLISTLVLMPLVALAQTGKSTGKHCVAYIHPDDKADAPFQCFPDSKSLQDYMSSDAITTAGTRASSLVLLVRLWSEWDYQGDELQIYGPACNAYGQLTSLGFMNNRASSVSIDCHGQISGYYWDHFYMYQNFGGSWSVAYSQVTSAGDSRLYWPSNDNYESFKNSAQ